MKLRESELLIDDGTLAPTRYLSLADRLLQHGDQVLGLLTQLLKEHANLQYEPLNRPGDSVRIISGAGDYTWKQLTREGRDLQVKGLNTYERFWALFEAMMDRHPFEKSRCLPQIADADRTVRWAVKQTERSHEANIEAWLTKLRNAFAALRLAVEDTYCERDRPCVVPDTNALLFHPALDGWDFPEFERFEVVLTPVVIAELDRLKKSEAVGEKATGLIRRIKEYRRRGQLTEGVPLRKDRSWILALAVVPEALDIVPWLKTDSADDRLLACAAEIACQRVRSPVVLVTRDINLQNKAEVAGISFCEPPEPPGVSSDEPGDEPGR